MSTRRLTSRCVRRIHPTVTYNVTLDSRLRVEQSSALNSRMRVEENSALTNPTERTDVASSLPGMTHRQP